MDNKKIYLLASAEALQLIKNKSADFFTNYVHAVVPYSPEQPVNNDLLSKVNAAFLSRDITGASTKHQVLPPLGVFSSSLLAARSLQWVHTHAAGTDRPIYAELKKHNILITTSTGANANTVAQSVLAAVLALNRKFKLLEEAQRNKTWRPLMGEYMPKDLQSQTAVVLGWGMIGQKIAAYLQMLGIEITVVRRASAVKSEVAGPYAVQSQAVQGQAVQMISYDDFKENSVFYDWVILACPLTETTRNIISKEFIDTLPASTHIVNVSRGDVVDEAALITALQNGRLAGAYLDVFAHEPLDAESGLWSLPNTIVSPHSAGHADGNYDRVIDLFMANLKLWAENKPLINLSL